MLGTIKVKLEDLLGDFYNPAMTLIKTVVVLIIAFALVKVGRAVIKKLFDKQKKLKFKIDDKRIDTISTLTISIFKYTVYIGALLTILSGILDLKAILAAAGVGGVALGFGAQSLVKDTISGFFILLEDQYAVGDMVTIEGLTGTVEHMELRVTRLKNFTGDLYIIPNGEIRKVINHTRDNKLVIVDIPIAYSSNMAKVNEIAKKVCDEVKEKFDKFTEDPSILGITSLGEQSMNLRITARTLPNEQWEIERHIRLKIKEEFEKNGLEFFDRTRLIRPE
ncbi:MscS Mechanosensitive ion channel [Ruminiclostridium papyrosolvens DSM 2782]|uniref:MscS Mechanosensitive ion channel n=1 Tax=Ruminiclostridium papyrosolvens DSM 2782 TaxID=588581 RepID=F1TB46_9FIRM|nr:mechanosensitive ion channel family protein [Ruminiclostridium papyrosolvens]EGD48250.1 MscS Mechanosensitive ion channel [Ruminiclostridium papyrosolvens DSM 2782]WES34242.1 mechanosensitive ion channel family protein [Ruminiclostridium papyrosolvens DSM 2782]